MIRKFLSEKIGKVCPSTAFRIKWNGDERGDYSTNVGDFEKAEKIKKELASSEYISKIETTGGFVNFWLSNKALEEEVANTCDSSYLLSLGKGQKAQVEFISANPTGPLTLGNSRGGVYGDVLANVLKEAGFETEKEYYVNDAGSQIKALLEDDGAYSSVKETLLKNVSEDNILNEILKMIKKTVAEMGIEFDKWFSETEEIRNTGKVDEIIKWLEEKGLTEEKDEALWFKASQFGDTEDRVLKKQDGEWTYFAVDCAYHKNKFEDRKFDRVIDIWGADHHGAVARLKGFVEAIGHKDKLEIILMQHVRLIKDGKPFRMSKREGTFVLVDEVLKEVGKDAFRYFMLTRSANTHMDFDMNLAKEQSKKNPVYYIQYAGARMSSILEKASSSDKNFDLKKLDSPHERKLILKLIQLPEVIEDIAKDYQVHKLATYAYELAKTFTDFYENVRVLPPLSEASLAQTKSGRETDELKQARLSLVATTRQILECVLTLMGISAPKKM